MKLFTSLTCGPCRVLKEMLKTGDNDVEVEYIDAVSESGAEQCQKYGIKSVPTLLTDDEEVITGIEDIKEKLGI